MTITPQPPTPAGHNSGQTAMTPNLPKPPKHDRTQQRRQAKRRQRLDEIAQAHGFGTWGKLETAVLNGAIITIHPHPGH